MKPKILLIGAGGFLGSAVLRHFRGKGMTIRGCARSPGPGELPLDLAKPVAPQLTPALKKENFSHAVLCAAIADIEACFKDPEGSHRVNVTATTELLDLFREFRIKPIFFSSDQVFGSQRDYYDEDDAYAPTNLYGRQKMEGERLVREKAPDHLIFRTSKQMSFSPGKRNILSQVIDQLREGKIVNAFRDQFITPVFIEDVAEVIERSIGKDLVGTYHLAADERLSRLELAEMIRARMGKPKELVQSKSIQEFGFSEPRGGFNTIRAEKISRTLNFTFRRTAEGIGALLP